VVFDKGDDAVGADAIAPATFVVADEGFAVLAGVEGAVYVVIKPLGDAFGN